MTTAGSPSPRKRRGLAEREFGRILIIKPSSLGDIVHALPVLHGLRHKYASAQIDWMVGKPFAPLLQNHPDLSELLIFDRRRFGSMLRSPRILGEFARFVGHLRAAQYDLVIDLQGLLRTGFLAWVSGARVRIGFRNAREGAPVCYTHFLEDVDANMHAVDRNYLAAGLLGLEPTIPAAHLALTDADRLRANRLLEAGKLGTGFLAVAPAARWETKVWPAERFAEAISAWQSDASLKCVLLGGPDEVDLCTRIAAACRHPAVNLAGMTDLRTLCAIVERAGAVLCLDSGIMHLAVALNRPLVCITGPTNPRRTGPWRRVEDVLRLDLACSPCYLRRLPQCPHQHACMRDLSVDAVVEALRRRLPILGPVMPG